MVRLKRVFKENTRKENFIELLTFRIYMYYQRNIRRKNESLVEIKVRPKRPP